MFVQQYSQETLHSQSHISVYKHICDKSSYAGLRVHNRWTRLVDWTGPVDWTGLDWTGGLDWWTRLHNFFSTLVRHAAAICLSLCSLND